MPDSEPSNRKEKWFFKTWTLVVSILVVGPLALPLLWANPSYSRSSKIFWTVLVIGLTIVLTVFTWKLLHYLIQQLSQMSSI